MAKQELRFMEWLVQLNEFGKQKYGFMIVPTAGQELMSGYYSADLSPSQALDQYLKDSLETTEWAQIEEDPKELEHNPNYKSNCVSIKK